MTAVVVRSFAMLIKAALALGPEAEFGTSWCYTYLRYRWKVHFEE